MLKIKKVVKYDPQHGMYFTKSVLIADEIVNNMLKNITLSGQGVYFNYDVMYKDVEQGILKDGIYDLFMCGKLNQDEYSLDEIKIIEEVYNRPRLERRAIFRLLNTLNKEFTDDELEELVGGD